MSIYDDAGAQWNIDPNLLRAIEQVESRGRTQATSPAGAQGNMQFMPPTARGIGVANTREPAFSVPAAAKLLHDLLDGPAQGDITTAIRMYHGGPDRSKWGAANAAYAPAVFAALNGAQAKNAPPTAPLADNPARMSDDDLMRQLEARAKAGGATSTPSAAPTPAPSVQQPTFTGQESPDDIIKQLDQRAAAATASNQDVSGRPMNPRADLAYYMKPHPEAAAAFNAGAGQAIRDVGGAFNRVGGWAVDNIPGVGPVARAIGYDPNAVAASNAAARTAFDKQYGDNSFATIGRIGGQAAATAPVMAVANPLIARGVGAGVDALEATAPQLAPYARSAVNVLSGNAGAPTAATAGSVPLQIASRGAQGGVLGAETAALTSGQSDNPLSTQMAHGALTGGAFGAGVPAAGAAYNTLTGRSAVIDPGTARLAQMARDVYGIQPTAPQLGMSPTLAYANSALKMVPGSGVGAGEAETRGQWIRAVSRTFGEDTDRITPEVLSNARGRIGGVMNDIEGRARVALDDQFLNRAAQIESAAHESLTPDEFAIVKRQLNNVMKNVESDDALTGQTYGNLIHKGSPLDAALNSSNSNVRNFAGQIRSALQDSLARSLPEEEAAAYQNARTQYKNLMTVRPLVLRADTVGGPAPSIGDINPQNLRMQVNRSYGENVAMAPAGTVPLNDLAKIGQMLKLPQTSGTAERGSMMYAGAKAAQLLGALATGGGAYAYGGVPAALTGLGTLGAGIAGGRAAGAYLRSPRLANNMIDASLNPLMAAPVNPLMIEYGAPAAALALPAR